MDYAALSENWYKKELEPYGQIEKAHLNSIQCIDFNPMNINELVSGSHDSLLKIWDLTKMKNSTTLAGHKEGVWTAKFSPDGKTLLSGSPDKMVHIWDIQNQKPSMSLKEHQNKVYWASFNETGNLIASGGEDSRLIIWDIRKGSPLQIINSPAKIIYSVEWSKDGNFLCTSEFGGTTQFYDAKQFELLSSVGQFHVDERAWSCDLDFGKDSRLGGQVFVGLETRYVKVYNFDAKSKQLEFDHEFFAHMDPVKHVAVDGPRGLLLTACRDGSARVWEGQKQEHKTLANLTGHTDNVADARFAPTSKGPVIIATACWDQTLRLFKM